MDYSKRKNSGNITEVNQITDDEVKHILSYSGCTNEEFEFKTYTASDKMLGFLGDYWKLKVIITENYVRKELSYFIKAISRSNASKANMVKELDLFQREHFFYTTVKNLIYEPGLKPWSAKFVVALDDAMVFEDLNELGYKICNKFKRFDMAHILLALRTVANLHASTIIFEENKRKELQRSYSIIEQFEHLKDGLGYKVSSPWFDQCKKGALEAIKTFSEYRKDNHTMDMIESRWDDVWASGIALGQSSSKHRNVICHRDLWNNNILFHYRKVLDALEPDDCVFVDFQAVCAAPPVTDLMLLLYCNLEPKFREQNMAMLLNYYHQELRMILYGYGISVDSILPREEFLTAAEEYRLCGLVLCACLIPQFWVDDDLTVKFFGDSTNFTNIMTKNKAEFIKRMMLENPDYKKTVMTVFEEIVERYCI